MNQKEILLEIEKILQKVFANKNLVVTPETSAKDIEDWDSLNHITIIEAIEKTFQIKLSLSEIVKVQNIGQMADLVLRKKA